MKISTKEVRDVTSMLDDIIEEYKVASPASERDWRTYEQRVANRLRTAFNELNPLVQDAVHSLRFSKGEMRGAKPKLTLEQKVFALLLKHLIEKSNRDMSFMLVVFQWLSHIEVSYKTIERLYSDLEVILVLYNLHALMLQRKGIRHVDCSGDGSGYGLCVRKHYATEAGKLKDKMKTVSGQKAKNNGKKKRKKALFVYSFVLMDIRTRMYIAFGKSFKSEKEAFLSAIKMVKELKLDIVIDSLRLDRYYQQGSVKFVEKEIGKMRFYIIPKKNATIRGSWQWKRMLHQLVHDTEGFLTEYFQRNQSESGFAEDKRRTGWQLGQKRSDRVNTANILTGVWHNLYRLNG
jgi:transposase